jgi:hypothetical protein
MKSYKTIGVLLALAVASALVALPAAGQNAVSSPVVVQQSSPKPIWVKAEVIHFDSNMIIVRESANERMVHTFTYGPRAQSDVQKALNSGGYQYGDIVKIRYMQGQTVALAIHGKASKTVKPQPYPQPAAPLKPTTPR